MILIITTAKLIKYSMLSQLGTGTPALIFIANDLGFIGKNKCVESQSPEVNK